jgi:hypothetical protein
MSRAEKSRTAGWAYTAHPADLLAGSLIPAALVLLLCLMLARAAVAGDEDEAAPATVISASALVSLGSSLDSAEAVSDTDLETQRAKAMIEVDKIVINDQNLTGVVSDNSAINTVSGDNAISGDAFSAASGFISSIQNTGNNVLIQNATIVNITVEP